MHRPPLAPLVALGLSLGALPVAAQGPASAPSSEPARAVTIERVPDVDIGHAVTAPPPLLPPGGGASGEPAPVTSLNPLTLPADKLAAIPPEYAGPLVSVATGARLVSVSITGDLIDDRAALEAALANDLRIGAPFDIPEAQRLAYKLWQLEYVSLPAAFPAPGGVSLTLDLEPALIVRHVHIVYDDHPYVTRVYRPVFDSDLLARMPLHQGAVLPAGLALGTAVDTAEDNLLQYLRDNGYYDAKVSVDVVRGGAPQEADLTVHLRHVWIAYSIGKITVNGNHALSDAEFEDAIGGGTYNKEHLRSDITDLVNLYHDRGYPYARIQFPRLAPDRSRRAIDLSFDVTEGRRVELRFVVDGTPVEATADLRNATKIFSTGSADEYALQASAESLVHFFQTQGFLEARVTYEHNLPQGPGDVEVITFHIERGPELKVREVSLVGAHALPSDRLLAGLNTQVFPRFLGFFGLGGGGYATTQGLAEDVQSLALAYHDQGFLFAQVTARVAPDAGALDAPGALAAEWAAGVPSTGDLYVRFEISEGPQTVVGAVRFVGNRAISTPTLLTALAYQPPGHPFVAEDVEKDVERLRDVYSARGYPYADVEVNAVAPGTPAEAAHPVDITYSIHEGPHTVMGHLFVRGNFHTRADLIRRTFPLRPGASYDEAAVENYREELLGLGLPLSRRLPRLFRSVEVAPLGYQENPVDIVVQVTEEYDDYGEVDAEVGYSTDECLNETLSPDCWYLALTYADKDLLGRGWVATVHGRVGLFQLLQLRPLSSPLLYADVDINNPRFLTLAGSYVQLDAMTFDREEETVRLGQVRTIGARFVLSDRLTDDLTANAVYDVESINHPEQAASPAGPLGGVSQVIVPTRVGEIGAGLLFDRRRVVGGNDFLRKVAPDSGWYVQGQATLATDLLWPRLFGGRGSDFAIFHGQAGWWQPLPGHFRLGLGAEYDHGVPFGGAAVLPQARQFFAGGDTTIRGYPTDEFKREIVQYEIPGIPGGPGSLLAYRVIPEGGNIRALTHLELMRPFGALIPFALLDAGYLIDSYADGLHQSDIGESVGLGLRVWLVAGYISFEYAIPVADLGALPLIGNGSPAPLGDQRAPTFGLLIPGRFHINFNYIY